MLQRYHVWLGDKRTTVSLDDQMADLFAIKLDKEPGSKKAKKAIRLWLQSRLDEFNDPGRIRVSQWLKNEVMLQLVDKVLSKKYSDWTYKELFEKDS